MTKPTFYPTLTYQDAPAAIQWLEQAFGFRLLLRVPDGKGGIAHAEMAFEDGIVMLGSENELMGPPTRQNIYVAVADPDAHHDRAEAAGARITLTLRDTDYGSRDYGCEDPEGHRWFFGTYRPGPRDKPKG
jgi:uncharacterized glyoxalase superfamily protein PhnB